MKLPSHFPWIPYSVVAACLVVGGGAYAEEIDDVALLTTNALAAMNAEKWDEALLLLQQVTDGHGKDAFQTYGPQFGVLWYRRGVCEIRLRKWQEAMGSFEKCYRDFPNAGRKSDGGNLYQKKALLKWGEAAVGAQQWQTAVQMFSKFLDERDRTVDTFPQGTFHVNLAICYFSLGQIAQGNEHLEIAISNRENFPTADTEIVTGFQSLVAAAIKAKNEQILLDFIRKNRALICFEPGEQQRYTRVYLGLGANAAAANMNRAALALYQLVPDTDVAIDALKAKIHSLGSRPALVDGSRLVDKTVMQEDLEWLEADRRGNHPADAIKLTGTAAVHEKLGNLRGACAAYEQLERNYERSETREENLFNLVRTVALAGDFRRTDFYGEKFLETFPKSEQVPVVRTLQLTSLFAGKQYNRCIEVAAAMMGKLDASSKERDLCLHVFGGSLYYRGEAAKAQPLLDEHVARYPASPSAAAALFFQASNSARLKEWSKAAERLDAFLSKKQIDGTALFFPYALYDRACCHHALGEDSAALGSIDRLVKEFPDAEVVDLAWNLKGRILQGRKEDDAAKAAYTKALEVAGRHDHSDVSSAVLADLVALLGRASDKARLKEVTVYADRFWKNSDKNAPDRARVAIDQARALHSVGRGEEALNRLREVMPGLSGEALDQALHAYTEVYRLKFDLAQLKDHCLKFPGIPAEDKIIRPRLLLSVIGATEEVLSKTKDETARKPLEAQIEGLYQAIKTGFSVKDLESPVLLRLGDFLRERTSSPRESLPFYEEVLSRPHDEWRYAALYGRGDVYARSSAADADKGIADFEEVYSGTKDPAEREIALFRIIGCYLAKDDRVKCLEKAHLYQNSGFTRFATEVDRLVAGQGANSTPTPEP